MLKSFPQLTAAGIKALRATEDDVEFVYDDSHYPPRMWKIGTEVRGNLTAGVGHLLNPAEIHKWAEKIIPQSVRDAWFDKDTDTSEKNVNDKVRVHINAAQRDALIMFDYNVGVDAFGGSTLLRKLNAGNYEAVPTEMMKWTKTTIKGKKVTSAGLVKRRAQEIAIWNSGYASAEPTGTQIAEPETPKTFNLDNISAGAGIVSTVFSSITDGPLAYVVAGIAAVAFGVTLYLFFTKRLFPR